MIGDVLFLAHRVPYPPDRGDKVRSCNVLRHLSGKGRVHVVAFADGADDLRYGSELTSMATTHHVLMRRKSRLRAAAEAVATGRPISLTAFADDAMRDTVANVLRRHPIETIYVYSGQMAQYLPDRTDARIVMDFVDMDSAKFAAYSRDANPAMAWVYRREARLLCAFERNVADRVDASLFVSNAEAALFRTTTGASRVMTVENGIDTAWFAPDASFSSIEAAGPLIVFTGQMDYRPNAEAVCWFARDVLPFVRIKHPDARFAIVGRQPGDAVRALERLPGVVVTGAVDDVRGWLAAASVVVAPLLLARGIQNKVLEGMAMARPVVATPAAAEGIDHLDTLCVADGRQAFAATVSSLITDPVEAERLGRAARAQAIARYGWSARLRPLDRLLAGERACAA